MVVLLDAISKKITLQLPKAFQSLKRRRNAGKRFLMNLKMKKLGKITC